jgi:hypothetical protein
LHRLRLLCETNLLRLISPMWCYSNICANDGLIRFNKFISQFTDGFCNLFFIIIRTPLPCNTKCDTPKRCPIRLPSSCVLSLSIRSPWEIAGWSFALGKCMDAACSARAGERLRVPNFPCRTILFPTRALRVVVGANAHARNAMKASGRLPTSTAPACHCSLQIHASGLVSHHAPSVRPPAPAGSSSPARRSWRTPRTTSISCARPARPPPSRRLLRSATPLPGGDLILY